MKESMQLIDRDFLIETIHRATSDVFVMMLDSSVKPGLPFLDNPENSGGVVSLVGFTGSWSGTGSLLCSPAVAARLSARMVMDGSLAEADVITDEVMDAVAELTNMIVGNIKHALESRLGPMDINIPTVIYGRNFRFKSQTGMAGISVPFAWARDAIEIRLCLAPAGTKCDPVRKAGPIALQHV